MEVDEEDPIKVWQDPTSYPPIPDDFIVCPLKGDALKDNYSLNIQGIPSFYSKQVRAMTTFYTHPPLTKPIPTSTSKHAKANMAPLGPDTIEIRERTLNEFVGFCAKWLNLKPTMEHALDPQVVAKYMGFHVAKGSKEGTLKRISTNLSQATTFITSTFCPKLFPTMDDAQLKDIKAWYSNLNGRILASMLKHNKAKHEGITLWMVWEASHSKWQAFQMKLKVGGCVCGVMCHGIPLCTVWYDMYVHVCTCTTHGTFITITNNIIFPSCAEKQGEVGHPSSKGMHGVCALHADSGPLPTTHESGGLEAHAQHHFHQSK